jgi:hypothetical protein
LQLLLLSAYLVSRWLAVGTVSTNVYSNTQVLSGSELLVRVFAHVRAFFSIAAEAPLAASVAMVSIIAAFAMSLKARCKPLLWFTAVWLAIVFIGAAMHFRAMVGDGDGYRLYYLAVLGVALCVAAGVASGRQRAPRLTLTLLLAGCSGLAIWQNAVNQQWWIAAKEIKATTEAIRTELPTLANSDYAIVLLEDPIGHVPAFRNAQGAVIRAAKPRRPGDDSVDFMVAFLPSQLNEWHRLMQEDVVGMITKRADAPVRPTRFYCKQRGEVTLRHLGVWPADTIGEWRQKWVAATNKNCPTLKL